MHSPNGDIRLFGDEKNLDELVEFLQRVGFHGPKWTFEFNKPISLLTCSKRKFLCDVVAYRDGAPV